MATGFRAASAAHTKTVTSTTALCCTDSDAAYLSAFGRSKLTRAKRISGALPSAPERRQNRSASNLLCAFHEEGGRLEPTSDIADLKSEIVHFGARGQPGNLIE